MQAINNQSIEYDGLLFTLNVKSISDRMFLPIAPYQSALAGVEGIKFLPDTEPYALRPKHDIMPNSKLFAGLMTEPVTARAIFECVGDVKRE
jgi:hypothetical protein